MPLLNKSLVRSIGAALLVVCGSVHAESGVVVGFVTLNIAAGTNASPTVSTLSLPLYAPIGGNGAVTGRISDVAASTITNSTAGWTPDAFAGASQPYVLKITSGAAAGRIFTISANTATVVTVDNQGTALDSLGIDTGANTGDTYEIFPADTVISVFGTPAEGIVGGTSADQSDQVQLLNVSTGWESYFYNTTADEWQDVSSGANGNNRIIRPDEGLVFVRRGTTPLQIVLSGRVPDTTSRIVVANSGPSALGSVWPVDETLGNSGIEQLSGWVSGPVETADQVQIYSPAKGWRSFYHNGSNWMRVGPPIVSDNESITAGTAVILARQGSASGSTVLVQDQPYDLNN